MARATREAQRRRGFSLIELLVVLLIFGILISIAVPSLIATQPERNLAAAGDTFANDFNYARAKAEATGNNVYVAFEFYPDERQIEGLWDPDELQPELIPTRNGMAYLNPGNPGISRVAKAYYIVEERPRYKDDDSPYTYLDWLDDYDRAAALGSQFYPVEPMFPFSVEDTYAAGVIPDPTRAAVNAMVAPLSAYPQDMRSGDEDTTYLQRYRVLPADLAGADGWRDAERDDQQFKIFCIADELEILSYDQNPDGAGYVSGDDLPRSYDPVPGGAYGNYPGSSGDHPRLRDQVVDYVLLKRVELPDHVYFMNAWKNTWIVGWEDVGGDRYYDYQDMQFLQYLWQFQPSGEVALAEWGYDPEPFPDGNFGGMVHGDVIERPGIPTAHMMWMVLEECVDFGSGSAVSRASVLSNRKGNQLHAGRSFCFWPLNGKYYVADYTPNDGARHIDRDSPFLNKNYNGETGETDEMPLVAREYGYSQNFLVPPASYTSGMAPLP